MTLNGASAQTIGGPLALTFYDLVANDPAGVTLGANVTVSNVLNLNAGSFTLGPRRLTISNAIAGTTTNLVADGTSSLTVTGAGAGIVLPSSVAQLDGADPQQRQRPGDLQADLTIGRDPDPDDRPGSTHRRHRRSASRPAGRSSGPRAGSSAVPREARPGRRRDRRSTFEIGDATRYAPVSVAFGTVTTPGDLTASTTPATTRTSRTPASPRPRASTASGRSRTRASPSTPTTRRSPSSAARHRRRAPTRPFIVAKRDGATWTRPTVGTRTALSTQATGMTSFSDFAVGEPTRRPRRDDQRRPGAASPPVTA